MRSGYFQREDGARTGTIMLWAVKNLGASPEAFGGTGAVRSVTIHGRHGGRPSSIKAEASFGVSDPMGINNVSIKSAWLFAWEQRNEAAEAAKKARVPNL